MCLPGGKRPLQIPHARDVLGAFYSEKLPGLSGAGRIVVLNTNLYYSSNEQTAGMADPSQQFQWLDEVLTKASQAGEMVRAPCSSPPSLGSLPEQVPHFGTDSHSLTQDAHDTEGPSSAWHLRGLLPFSQQPVSLGPIVL